MHTARAAAAILMLRVFMFFLLFLIKYISKRPPLPGSAGNGHGLNNRYIIAKFYSGASYQRDSSKSYSGAGYQRDSSKSYSGASYHWASSKFQIGASFWRDSSKFYAATSFRRDSSKFYSDTSYQRNFNSAAVPCRNQQERLSPVTGAAFPAPGRAPISCQSLRLASRAKVRDCYVLTHSRNLSPHSQFG